MTEMRQMLTDGDPNYQFLTREEFTAALDELRPSFECQARWRDLRADLRAREITDAARQLGLTRKYGRSNG